jgi:hypothetical protein
MSYPRWFQIQSRMRGHRTYRTSYRRSIFTIVFSGDTVGGDGAFGGAARHEHGVQWEQACPVEEGESSGRRRVQLK